MTRYLDDESMFLAGVEACLLAAERGQLMEEEEMDARLEAMFTPGGTFDAAEVGFVFSDAQIQAHTRLRERARPANEAFRHLN